MDRSWPRRVSTPTKPSPTRRGVGPLLAAVLILSSACLPGLRADSEADALLRVMAIRPGMTVADLGAGDGEWSEVLARGVGADGHVIATEVDENDLPRIERRLRGETAGFEVVHGTQTETGLPEGCCDAILVRLVYHHFERPEAMRGQLYRALRPGGLLFLVETEPRGDWSVEAASRGRSGHEIPFEILRSELQSSGFELVSHHPDWFERRDYGALFRRPAETP